MREFYRDLLSSRGYAPLVAKDGHDALRLLSASEDEVAIVVSDFMMSDIDGARLAARIKCRYPRVPVILVTGSPPVCEGLAHLIDAVVEKPCPPERIIELICALLPGRTSTVETEA